MPNSFFLVSYIWRVWRKYVMDWTLSKMFVSSEKCSSSKTEFLCFHLFICCKWETDFLDALRFLLSQTSDEEEESREEERGGGEQEVKSRGGDEGSGGTMAALPLFEPSETLRNCQMFVLCRRRLPGKLQLLAKTRRRRRCWDTTQSFPTEGGRNEKMLQKKQEKQSGSEAAYRSAHGPLERRRQFKDDNFHSGWKLKTKNVSSFELQETLPQTNGAGEDI